MKNIILLILIVNSFLFAEKLATVHNPGLIINDTFRVYSFQDPDIKGIACYASTPVIAMSFSCKQIGPISGDIKSKSKIFEASSKAFIKGVFVDRIFDKRNNTLIYFRYTRKIKADSSNNTISVVPLTHIN